MLDALLDTLAFARGTLRPRPDLRTTEVPVEPDDGRPPVPATLVEPQGVRMPDGGRVLGGTRAPEDGRTRPAWVVLHGLTRPGRAHPSLVRFTEAVASTGARVLIPEIREWTEMDFAPERAQGVIRGAVAQMARDPRSLPGGVVLVGFSFGAPQALLVGSDPAFRPLLRAVVGWGGYADLQRTVLFQFTGEHRWKDEVYRLPPDPYGRWVVGANCLRLAGPLGDTRPVAEALRELAIEAGERQVVAWDPIYEGLKRHLRRGLPERLRPLYDLFVSPEGVEPEPEAAREVVDTIVALARREIPLIEPVRAIEGLPVPVRLLHPRDDHLIPFTETLALGEMLRHGAPDLAIHLTGLLGHSGRGGATAPLARAGEALGLLRALARIFELSRRR